MPRKASWFVLVLVVLLLGVTSCGPKQAEKLEPKIAPPAIDRAGVLRAGVDMSLPPFAGKDGRDAGIDLDVAAALADRLGLTVEYVDLTPSEVATALAEGKIDIALSVPLDRVDLERMSSAGTYIDDAPAFFISAEDTKSADTSLTLDTVPPQPIAAQEGSQSFWLLRSELGSETIKPYETLRQALDALQQGEVKVAAGDAIVGAYIARDMPTVRFAGQLALATPMSVVVEADNTQLADAVRTTLDELAADGVLDSVRRKWVGDLPALTVAEEPAEEEPAQ